MTLGTSEPIATTSRAEVLDLVSRADSYLLVADMTSTRGLGNIGARLMRAVAQRPEIGERGRRIIFSRYNVNSVLDGLRPFVHAFCAFSDVEDNAENLYRAIRHALALDGEWTEPLAFPALQPVDEWEAEVQTVLEELVGEQAARVEGYAEIALLLAAGV